MEDFFFHLLREFLGQAAQFIKAVNVTGAGRVYAPRLHLRTIGTTELY
jgi:hypothetical protein